jgi:hypothetical protein
MAEDDRSASTASPMKRSTFALVIVSFLVGTATGALVFQDRTKQTGHPQAAYQSTIAVSHCQLCKPQVEFDFQKLHSLEDLDRALCPRKDETEEVEGVIFSGARVRLRGVAHQGGFKEPAALKIGDGMFVVASRGLVSAERFFWEASAVGREIVVEGCISRSWAAPPDEYYRRLVDRDPKRARLANRLRGLATGYGYRVDVIAWRLAESDAGE